MKPVDPKLVAALRELIAEATTDEGMQFSVFMDYEDMDALAHHLAVSGVTV